MPEFLLESFVPNKDGLVADARTEPVARAAEQMRREGTRVRYLRSILLPRDEMCLYFFEAASAEDVAEAARRAGLPFERVTAAISVGDGSDPDGRQPPYHRANFSFE